MKIFMSLKIRLKSMGFLKDPNFFVYLLKNVYVFGLLISTTLMTVWFFFFNADGFSDYSESFYFGFGLIMIISMYAAFHFQKERLLQIMNDLELLINESK